ncbi:MAG: hypothetical protein ACOH5I_08955 [Oligoflexus sp.]
MRLVHPFHKQFLLLLCSIVSMSSFARGADLEQLIQTKSYDELLGQSHIIHELEQIPSLSRHLWQKYRQSVLADVDRVTAHDQRQLVDGDKTMHFSFSVKGPKPDDGYPLYIALHGGGGTASVINDSQWGI